MHRPTVDQASDPTWLRQSPELPDPDASSFDTAERPRSEWLRPDALLSGASPPVPSWAATRPRLKRFRYRARPPSAPMLWPRTSAPLHPRPRASRPVQRPHEDL